MNDQSVNELWSLIKDGMHNTILEDTKSDLKLLPAIAKGDSADGMVDVLLNGSDANDTSQIMTIPNMTGQSIAENDNVWVAYMYSLDNAYVMYTADQFTNGMPEWAIASELAQSITTQALTVGGYDMLNGFVYKGELTSADDLDDYKTSGIFYITSSVPSHAPDGATTYSTVFVIHPVGNFVQQIYVRPTLTQGLTQISVRQWSGSTPTWSKWRSVNDMPFAKAIHQIVTNDDLNDFTDTGVYYCANSATTQTLSHSPYTEGIWADGTTGFRLEVYNTTGTGYGFQILYTHNVVQRTYIRSLNDNIWRAWHRIIGDDEIYYRAGNTSSPNAFIAQGYLSESSKRIRFQVELAKSNTQITSATLTACKINAYHSGGGYCIGSNYVTGGTDVLNGSGYTTTIAKISDRIYRVQIDRTTAFNGADNSPVIVECNAITFSFS